LGRLIFSSFVRGRGGFNDSCAAHGEADVTIPVELRPGVTPLAVWRAIYRGAPVTLDPIARADVEAGRAALVEITSRNDSVPVRESNDNDAPSIAELIERQGEPLPSGLLRLFVALKLGSLGQGMSGARWRVVDALADCLVHDVLPVVPAGDASDRIALANLFGVLTGTGEALRKGKVRPAQKALKKADLKPVNLNPRERRALLSGGQLSIAAALAGLFEAERVFQSALVAAALSAVRYDGALLRSRAYRLNRQDGPIEVAAALRQLIDGHRSAAESAVETTASVRRGDAQVMGACLDLLRQAAATLERAANAVTEDELVIWQSDEIIAGAADLSAASLSADLIALALRVVGDLSEARINTLAAPGQGDAVENDSRVTGLEAKAGTFMAEIRERAHPAALDPDAVWRLAPMIGKTALVIAIEILRAAEAENTSADTVTTVLDPVRKSVRDASHMAIDSGVAAASNLASVAMLVGSGALVTACGVTLPSLTPSALDGRRSWLGGQAKRT
jgi:histidine ammonia-lyase